MSYTEDIVRRLIDTLSRTAELPTFQLAGHVPNLAFWMAEVRHALAVIDGYPKRFEHMVAAQCEFDLNHPDAARGREHHEYNYKTPTLAMTPAQAKRLSRELTTAANRVIDRCLKEALLDIVKADGLRELMLVGRPAAG